MLPRRWRRILAPVRTLWRRLTSMRTALVLLFLLAVAALPGALLPQWNLNRAKTTQYLLDHPVLGPWLDRFGFLSVFSAPWFAAIYLLLFTSLVGCLVPRTLDLLRRLRQPPPRTPRYLARLPHHAIREVAGPPEVVAIRIGRGLRRWRVRRTVEDTGAVSIAAEKGYLRELGNLLFHLSLLGLLVAMAVGKLVGYEGSVIVDVGNGFCSVGPTVYDDFRPGLLVDGTDLTPFCVNVTGFTADYTNTGQAAAFRADLSYQSGADAGTTLWTQRELRVNDPLRLDGQRLYLLGHGFTPRFRVTYPDGEVRDYAQPFQPMDSAFTSDGAVKITDPPGDGTRETRQLAIVGVFAPTAATTPAGALTSRFPAMTAPAVAIQVYRGNLGMEGGRPQSVFAIDTSQVTRGALVLQGRATLTPGQALTLADGTTVTFTGATEFVSLQTSYDPAQPFVLACAVMLLLGLIGSLTITRRRVWYRLSPIPGDTAGSRVEIGGLSHTNQDGYTAEFAALVAAAGSAATFTPTPIAQER
jgi:cytochrome c biogenesis protein